LKLFVQ